MENSDMTPGKLTRLESSPEALARSSNPLRTIESTGFFGAPPVAGMPFFFLGQPIDPAAKTRVIATSLVKSVTYEGSSITFKTANSTYILEVLG